MPIHRGKDNKGNYFQWGEHGAKYYYNYMNDSSVINAYAKAKRQMRAIYSNGYRGK